MKQGAISGSPANSRRRTGARTRRQRRATAGPPAVAGVRRRIPLYDLMNEEGLDLIDRTTDWILKEIGIEFRGDTAALALWRKAGADVRGERVRFEPGFLKAIIAESAPRSFIQHARNHERSVPIGQDNVVFAPAYGAPFVHDMDGGRRYGTLTDFENLVKLTYASPALAASKLPDAQAMQESVTSLHTALLCGANFILHAAGWLEAALTIGYEKLVLDADHLGSVHTLLGGLVVGSEALALDAFREVGPGNHFFGCAHTLSRYETAFHECEIADTDSYENWMDAGGKDSTMRANAKWKETLRVYEPPLLDAATDEALREYMARKKASMPDIWH